MSIVLIVIALVAFVLGASVLIDVNKKHKDDTAFRIFFSVVGALSIIGGVLILVLVLEAII